MEQSNALNQEFQWLEELLPGDSEQGSVGWQPGALLLARQREGATAVEKDRVVALWILAENVYEQVVDVPANTCATIALFFSKQVRIDSNPLANARWTCPSFSLVHNSRLYAQRHKQAKSTAYDGRISSHEEAAGIWHRFHQQYVAEYSAAIPVSALAGSTLPASQDR